MSHPAFDLLFAGAFATAAMALGALNAIGLLVWLAGCSATLPTRSGLSGPVIATNPPSAGVLFTQAGHNVPPLEHVA